MRSGRSWSPAALAAVLWMLAATAPAAAAPWVPGEVLVALEGDAPLELAAGGELRAGAPAVADALARLGLARGRRIGPAALRNALPGRRYLLLASDRSDFDPAAAARALDGLPGVVAASVNALLELCILPNDPYLGAQWHITTGTGAGIGLPAAWDLGLGDPGVAIAIMDTGVDVDHPDLAAAIWQNAGEIAGNGLDDDGNGYVDDVRGWDFGQDDADPRPHYTPDPMGVDVGFHGTHCAGIAAAVTDNGVGVAGAGWGCRIMPLKIVDGAGVFTEAAMTEAFLYAIAMGADVLSMSFGGPDEGGMAAFMQDLVDQATAAGIVCVAAAGNNADAVPLYPAACAGCLAVGATNSANQRASFSTYGTWVDLAAPGERIWSTICRNYSFDLLTQLLYMLSFEWDGVNPYMYGDGTSMACPLVAGVCGLVRTAAPGLGPDLVGAALVATGDVVAYDHPLGVKVNARAAVEYVQVSAAPPAAAAGPRLAGWPNPFNPRVSLSFVLPAAGRAELAIHDLAGRRLVTLLDRELPAGAHTAVWDGRDAAGRAQAAGVYLCRLTSGGRARSLKLLLAK